MRIYPVLVAAIVMGIFSAGAALVAYPATDNTAKPPKFDHKSLGKDFKDCMKCHKMPEAGKK